MYSYGQSNALEDMPRILGRWLQTFDRWNGLLQLDQTLPSAPSIGLFPLGVQQVACRWDIQGNTVARYRYRFALHCLAYPNLEENALWLLRLQCWINDQSINGLAPVFGYDQKIVAQNGGFKGIKQTGTAEYRVELVVEFNQTYQHNWEENQ